MLANCELRIKVDEEVYVFLSQLHHAEIRGNYPEFNGKPVPTFHEKVEFEQNVFVHTNGQPIGYAGYNILKEDQSLELLQLFVLKEHRGQGFGDELIRFVEERAIEQGCENILVNLLNCQKYSDVLFDRNGYHIVPNETAAKNKPLYVLMEKIL